MVLSGKTLKDMIKSRRLSIRPLEETQIQPASIDLRLSNEFMSSGGKIKKSKDILIKPKQFFLARTVEYVELPRDMAAFVKLRSSLARLGLFLSNAGWIDPGFRGTITLQFFNASDRPIKLESGMRFCQIVFLRLDQETFGYSGKYSGQVEVTRSKK